MRQLPSKAEMDRAFRGRDAAYDGIFLVGVKTTGIFCRPTCPARKPNPANVEFLATIQDALLAGYRPCKRCRPTDVNGSAPRWVRRLLATVEQAPEERLRDQDLRAMSIDPTRARRFFKKNYGMTFQAYSRARRLGLALKQLRGGADLLGVAYDSGYESNSGFREAFEKTFGASPGRGRMVSTCVTQWLDTPLGPMIAVANADGICLLEFADRRSIERQLATVRKRLGCTIVPGMNEHTERLAIELGRYFHDAMDPFTVPLRAPGTTFQEAVWNRLREIPVGDTISYEALALAVGKPGAVRAVGSANGANRIAIIIPCHRVVRNDTALGGYGGGLWRKQFLLDHERCKGGAHAADGSTVAKQPCS